MASSASSISSPTFSGSSTFSSSFQQVLTKAVQLASLPMQQMQNHVNDLTSQQQALTQLEATFQSLNSAIQNVNASTTGSVSASVSDPSSVSAATTSAALPGSYSIQVATLGSFSTTLSQAGTPTVTDPATQGIDSAASYTLTVKGKDTNIAPKDGSLDAMAAAINATSAGVQATVVNIGSNTSPDYRLVVTSENLGPDAIQLSDGPTDLLGSVSPGAEATYSVNGSSTVLQSNSRQVTLAPGLTVTMLNTSSQPDIVTVSTDFSALASALSSFASSYNSSVNGLQAQVGQNAGPLNGDSVVSTLNSVLRSLTQYSSGPGAVSSLNSLGLSVDGAGVMSFNASAFTPLNIADVTQFLGSASKGGFLQAANNALASAVDVGTGDIEGEFGALQNQIDKQKQLIVNEQTRITDMQNNLVSELTKADAAIATLQGQKTYYTELFAAEYPSAPAF